MNWLKFLPVLGVIIYCEAVINELNDADYNRMPDIFGVDDYESCMRHTDAVYCLVTLELEAGLNDELFQHIRNYSARRTHYNHTILDRGVCVPKSCKLHFNSTNYNKVDLGYILGECLNKTIWDEYKLSAKVMRSHYCFRNNDRKEFNNLDIFATILFIAIIGVNLVGTLYDIYSIKRSRYLTSFSILQNWSDLNRKGSDRSKIVSLKGFNGLRIISILIVIFAHNLYSVVAFGDRVQDLEKVYEKPLFGIFMYGLHIVQTFFAVSGFLLAYKLCEFEETSTISWVSIPKILYMRFLRLTPSYAVVMLLIITLTPHLGSGPFWNLFIGGFARDCHKYFWHHLFYINNYTEDVQCSVPTWYLAAEMQVFFVGLLVFCLTKHRITILSILFVIGLIGPSIDIWQNGLDPVAIITPEFLRSMSSDTFRFSHIRGHNNLPCYVTGMIVGLSVFKWQKQGVKIKSKLLTHLSSLVPLAVIFLFLSNNLLYVDGEQPTLVSKLIFAAAFRIILSAIIAFSLIIVTMKIRNPYNKLLCWSGWEVPSKLSYSVLLIHMNICFLLMGSRTTKGSFSLWHLVVSYIGVTVLSFILAVFLYISVEAPCDKLLRKTMTKTTDTLNQTKLKVQ